MRLAGVVLLATAGASSATAHADAPPESRANGSAIYAVPRDVIASGGGNSSGGAFSIRGSIGQLDADPLAPSSGGGFVVSGGFWPGIAAPAPAADTLFTNGFEAMGP